jgi:hypothetical protein
LAERSDARVTSLAWPAFANVDGRSPLLEAFDHRDVGVRRNEHIELIRKYSINPIK